MKRSSVPPYRRYPRAWLMRVRQDPDLTSGARNAAAWLVHDAPRRRERGNTYVMGRADLTGSLGVSPSTAKRMRRELEVAGWIVRCGGVGRGRPQRWHRSTPWDHVRFWGLKPCPRCNNFGTFPTSGKGVTVTHALTPALTPFRAQSADSSWYMALRPTESEERESEPDREADVVDLLPLLMHYVARSA